LPESPASSFWPQTLSLSPVHPLMFFLWSISQRNKHVDDTRRSPPHGAIPAASAHHHWKQSSTQRTPSSSPRPGAPRLRLHRLWKLLERRRRPSTVRLAGIARRNPNLGEASPPICLSFVGSQSNDPQQLTYPKGYGVIWALRSSLDLTASRANPHEGVPSNRNTPRVAPRSALFQTDSNIFNLCWIL
jgi:hypothetical protein